MSEIATLLGLERDGNCCGNCGRPTNGWFAPGHDYKFVMELLNRLVAQGHGDALRGVADEIRYGSGSSCPPNP